MNALCLSLKQGKTTTLVLLMVLGIFFFSACQKEKYSLENDLANIEISSNPLLLFETNCEEEQTCTDIICALSDEEDLENHRINMILYHYAQAVVEASTHPEWLCLMVEAMQTDTDGYGTSIPDLATAHPGFGQIIHTALQQSIEQKDIFPKGETDFKNLISQPNWNANDYLPPKFAYLETAYEPAIYFVKPAEHCNVNGPITVVIAEGINCEDEAMGWRDGVEVFVSEMEVKNSEGLYIFVGPAIPQTFGDSDDRPFVILDGEETAAGPPPVKIDVDRHQIKKGFRYEKFGKSDVRGFDLKFFQDDSDNHSLGKWKDFKPRRIKKKDIKDSKIFTENLEGFTMPGDIFNNNRWAFIGAWENDWYATPKVVPNPCSTFINHTVALKMKFKHEWYFNDCEVLKNWFPNKGSKEIFENNKCMFDLKRTD